MQLKYIVTGTGRCGTVFMARFLTSLGIPCGHESVFDYQGLEIAKQRLNGNTPPDLSYCAKNSLKNGKWVEEQQWLDDLCNIQADSSYMAAPFLGDTSLENVKIIHIVRDPIQVINSFCNYIDYFRYRFPTNKYEDFIYNIIQELHDDMPQYDRACLFYVKWNQMIENNFDFLYRVEDDTSNLCDFLEVSPQNLFCNKSINSHKKWIEEKFNIHMISSIEIKKNFVAIGRKYGYRMSTSLMI